MEILFEKLGIDWHLLIAQAANFLLLLVILRAFAYTPVLEMLRKRREAIEKGIAQAEEAGTRLNEAQEMAKHKMKEAEASALAMMKKTEADAKKLEVKLMDEVKAKEAEAMRQAELMALSREEEARKKMEAHAAEVVKAAIIKTVEMKPEMIDDALVRRAVAEVEKA